MPHYYNFSISWAWGVTLTQNVEISCPNTSLPNLSNFLFCRRFFATPRTSQWKGTAVTSSFSWRMRNIGKENFFTFIRLSTPAMKRTEVDTSEFKLFKVPARPVGWPLDLITLSLGLFGWIWVRLQGKVGLNFNVVELKVSLNLILKSSMN